MNLINLLRIIACVAVAWGCTSEYSRVPETANTEDFSHSHEHHHHHPHPENGKDREVMALHDSIMLRMEELVELSGKISQRIHYLDSMSKSADPLSYRDSLKEARAMQEKLESAEGAMMGWMRQYRADTLEVLDEEEVARYLAEQKGSVMEVQKTMELALRSALLYLDANKEGRF